MRFNGGESQCVDRNSKLSSAEFIITKIIKTLVHIIKTLVHILDECSMEFIYFNIIINNNLVFKFTLFL